jgi:signal transduction histidine kinase
MINRGTVSARLRRFQARTGPARLAGHLGNVALIGVALTLELQISGGARTLRGDGATLPHGAIAASTTVMFLLLLLRRRHPVAVFALHVGYATAAAWLIPETDFTIGVLISLHAVAARYRPRRSVVALPICALPFGLQQYQDIGFAPVITALSTAITVTAWLLGYRAWRAEKLQSDSAAATEQALRAERLRLARELHDIVSHSVSVMVLHAAGARAVLTNDPERAEAALRVIQETGTQSMAELRRLLGLLRSAGAGPPGEAGHQPGLDQLNDLVRQMRGAGLAIAIETVGTPGRLDPSVDLAAYRVVQESLTNTLKHAGAGSAVRVHLAWEPDALVITVQDRAATRPGGRSGRSRLSAGHGLLGLRERVATVGGTIDAHPIDAGFLVQATLPLTARVRPDPTAPARPTTEGMPR